MNYQEIQELLLRTRDLASYHRNREAITCLREALNSEELSQTWRHLLLANLAQLEVDFGPERQRATETIDALREFDSPQAAVESAWLAYYCGQVEEGLNIMASQFEDHGAKISPRAALLVGKLYTDQSRHEDARNWLLLSLHLARKAADQNQLAATFGALAEVFYRAGALDAALDLVELDAALLPPGSFHVERLRVYRAHLYRQSGQLDAARSQYHEAYQAACLRGFGQAYPLRGLLWCELLELVEDLQKDHPFERILELLEELRQINEPHSLANGLLATSRAFYFRNREEESNALLQESFQLFQDSGFPLEAQWCNACLSKAPSSSFTPSDSPAILPVPFAPGASDLWLTSIPLRPLAEGWHSARNSFNSDTMEAQLNWMGLFF